jgi:hypothetical protein
MRAKFLKLNINEQEVIAYGNGLSDGCIVLFWKKNQSV